VEDAVYTALGKSKLRVDFVARHQPDVFRGPMRVAKVISWPPCKTRAVHHDGSPAKNLN